MPEVELAERRSSFSRSASLEVPAPDERCSSKPSRDRDLGASLISSTPWCRHVASLVPVLPNPFHNDAAWTGWEVLEALLVGATLLPLRLAGLLLCALALLVPCVAVSIGCPLEVDRGCIRHSAAFKGWRRAVVRSLRLLARGAALCMGFWRIRVIDRRQDTSRLANILVVAPHLGPLDAILLAAVLSPMPCFVGRTEMAKFPAYFLACAAQAVLVNLKVKESKQSCRDAIAFRASSAWDGPPLAIFPEGSCTNGKALTQFKAGAFAPGEPVTPVLLRLHPNGDWDPSWVGGNRRNSLLWLLRLMCKVSNSCSIEILDEHQPDEDGREDPELFAEHVRGEMAFELGVDVTEHTYDDVFFYQEAALQAHVHSDFTLAAMKRLFDADLEGLKRWLQKFHAADTDRTGFLSRDEMVKALDLGEHSNVSVDKLFQFFDTDGSGAIEYREFVQAVALLSGKCSSSSLAKLAFLICDKQGTGLVAKDELLETLSLTFAEPSRRRAWSSRMSTESSTRRRRTSSSRMSTESSMRSSRTSESSLRECFALQADGGAVLNFQDFCRLVEQRPDVLDAALSRTRQRLSITATAASGKG